MVCVLCVSCVLCVLCMLCVLCVVCVYDVCCVCCVYCVCVCVVCVVGVVCVCVCVVLLETSKLTVKPAICESEQSPLRDALSSGYRLFSCLFSLTVVIYFAIYDLDPSVVGAWFVDVLLLCRVVALYDLDPSGLCDLSCLKFAVSEIALQSFQL